MKTRMLAKSVRLACCAVFLLGAVSRATEVFTVTFTAPGAIYKEPAFGINTLASDTAKTDTYDYGLYLPPFDQLTLRFTNNDYDGTLVKDIRAAGDAKTWVLEVSNLGSGQSFTLSWAVSDPGGFLGDASRFLTWTPRAGGTSTNLKSAGSVLVNANGLYDIVLKKTNSEPVAMPDSVPMFKQSEASKLINVLLNDRDPDDGQTLAIKSVVSPTTNGGTAAIEDKKIRYTPAVGFKGQDTFSYTIQDNGSPVLEASSTVTVQVEDVIYGSRSHAPSAVPGTTFTVTLTAYYAATYTAPGDTESKPITQIRFREYLPMINDSAVSWAYTGTPTVTLGCTVTPLQTGNLLDLTVVPSGAALPPSPGPITVTYQITVPADATVNTTKSLTGGLFVNGGGEPAISTVPLTSFTISLYHTADYMNENGDPTPDWKIDDSEIQRIIILFNKGKYYKPDATKADGFDRSDTKPAGSSGYHRADYMNENGDPTPDWKIDDSEIQRIIILFNKGKYYKPDATKADGFDRSETKPQ